MSDTAHGAANTRTPASARTRRKSKHKGMQPVFASGWDALALGGLLIACFALPIALPALGILDRGDVYATPGVKYGPYNYHHRVELTVETEPLDVVFLGFSSLWSSIDAAIVQRELSRQLGREARVVTLAGNWRGEDAAFVVLRDLLDRRRVDMVVMSAPTGRSVRSHPVMHLLWDPARNDAYTQRLPWRIRLGLWAESALGLPRHLMALIRHPTQTLRRRGVREHLGSLPRKKGFRIRGKRTRRFVARDDPAPALAAESLIYRGQEHPLFRERGTPYNPYEQAFFVELTRLAADHDTRLVLIDIPYAHKLADVVKIRPRPSAEVGAPLPVIGVPLTILFPGKSLEEIRDFYMNTSHMNANGARYFTETIMPAIVALYRETHAARQ